MKKGYDRLSKEQKAAFVLFLIIGLGAITFGFYSFGAQIRRPFDLQLATFARNAKGEFLTQEQQEAREVFAMKTRDTDEDGLSDYDEAFVYKTSAYIADTDSDGFNDKIEVFSGNDPNCPVGKNCSGALVSADEPGNTLSNDLDLEPSLPGGAFINPSVGTIDFTSEEDVKNYFLNLTITELREALFRSGIPKEQLEKIDDDTLRALMEEAVSTSSANGELQQLFETLQNQGGEATP